MRILNLVENEEGVPGCEAAHGLSFYIETQNHKLLFDTSPSDVVLRNAERLGVDLTAADTVILSHGHYDHSGGILAFTSFNPNAKIYLQNKAGGEFYAFDGEDKGFRYIGIDKRRSVPACAGRFKHHCLLSFAHAASFFNADAKNSKKQELQKRGLSLHVLKTEMKMHVLLARAASFGSFFTPVIIEIQLQSKLRMSFFYNQDLSLHVLEDLNTIVY